MPRDTFGKSKSTIDILSDQASAEGNMKTPSRWPMGHDTLNDKIIAQALCTKI